MSFQVSLNYQNLTVEGERCKISLQRTATYSDQGCLLVSSVFLEYRLLSTKKEIQKDIFSKV